MPAQARVRRRTERAEKRHQKSHVVVVVARRQYLTGELLPRVEVEMDVGGRCWKRATRNVETLEAPGRPMHEVCGQRAQDAKMTFFFSMDE